MIGRKAVAASVLTGGLVLTGGAVAGVCIGELANSATTHEVRRAERREITAEMGYLALAETGTCEYTVLKSTLETSPHITFRERPITKLALDEVCGESAAHEGLTMDANKGFTKLMDARINANDATNNHNYSTADKIAWSIGGAILTPLALAAAVTLPVALADI